MTSSPVSPNQPLNPFVDCRIVKVTVPLSGERTLELDGVVKSSTESSLDIQFLPQKLPLETELAAEGRWRLTFDKGLSFLTVWAKLSARPTPNHVQLTILNSELNQYARRDHRVNTEIYLRFWQAGDGRQELSPQRTPVNLSGYGISFHTETHLSAHSLVELELFLPGATLERIRCIGRVIRGRDQQQKPYLAALELVNPVQADIEKIIHFCMTEQFRSMQQKARMLASSMGPEEL